MTDLVNFYRNLVPPEFGVENPDAYGVMISAAKARETAAEIKRLREALREIGKKLSPEKYDNEVCLETYCGELARAALGEGKE